MGRSSLKILTVVMMVAEMEMGEVEEGTVVEVEEETVAVAEVVAVVNILAVRS